MKTALTPSSGHGRPGRQTAPASCRAGASGVDAPGRRAARARTAAMSFTGRWRRRAARQGWMKRQGAGPGHRPAARRAVGAACWDQKISQAGHQMITTKVAMTASMR